MPVPLPEPVCCEHTSDGRSVRCLIEPRWDRPITREFCFALPGLSRAIDPGRVIYQGRNLLFRASLGDHTIVVKSFRPPGLFRRLFLAHRQTKASRSFAIARKLKNLGIATPDPVAVVEETAPRGRAATFYCCTEVLPGTTARVLLHRATPGRLRSISALGTFIADIHLAQVHHQDLTAGNLLMRTKEPVASDDFTLVDLNRVRFCSLGPWGSMGNLCQIGLRGDDADLLIQAYGARRWPGRSTTLVRSIYGIRQFLGRVRWAIKDGTRPWRRRLGW